jgi:hypothetical protein
MWLKKFPPIRLDAGAFWRLVEEHGVNVLFSAPTAFRAMRQADPDGLMTKKYDLSTLRAIFVAGERSDPSTVSDCVFSESSHIRVILRSIRPPIISPDSYTGSKVYYKTTMYQQLIIGGKQS